MPRAEMAGCSRRSAVLGAEDERARVAAEGHCSLDYDCRLVLDDRLHVPSGCTRAIRPRARARALVCEEEEEEEEEEVVVEEKEEE